MCATIGFDLRIIMEAAEGMLRARPACGIESPTRAEFDASTRVACRVLSIGGPLPAQAGGGSRGAALRAGALRFAEGDRRQVQVLGGHALLRRVIGKVEGGDALVPLGNGFQHLRGTAVEPVVLDGGGRNETAERPDSGRSASSTEREGIGKGDFGHLLDS